MKTKKEICLLLSLILVFSTISISAAKTETNQADLAAVDFMLEEEFAEGKTETVEPVKQEYAVEVSMPEEIKEGVLVVKESEAEVLAEEEIEEKDFLSEELEMQDSVLEESEAEEGAAEESETEESVADDGLSLMSDAVVEYPVAGGVLHFNETTGEITGFTHKDTAITVVEVPSEINGVNVTGLADGAFALKHYRLTEIILPNTITGIGANAFNSCKNLTRVNIPKRLTSIGYCAFTGCAITSVELPNSVTSIDWAAFESCKSLKSIVLSSGMTKIENRTFNNCSALTEITIPKSVTNIGRQAFYDCFSLKDVYYGGTEKEWEQIQFDEHNDYLKNATIHYNSTYIPDIPEESTSTAVIQSVILEREGLCYNILTNRQSFERDSSEKVAIRTIINWGNASAGKVILSQGGVNYLESTDGDFGSVQPGKIFEPGSEVYIIAVDHTGNIVESKKIQLYITEKALSGDVDFVGTDSFRLFDALTFTVDEDKPVLGSQKFKIDLGPISSQNEIDSEKGTFKIAYGVDLEKDENGKFQLEQFKRFKETMKGTKANMAAGLGASAIHYGLLEQGIGKVSNFQISENPKVPETKAAVCGYIEGTYKAGVFTITEGGLIGNAEVSYTYEGQAFISVVPVYYSIGAGGAVELTAGVKTILPEEGLQPVFTGNLEPSVKFEIRGGVGVIYLGEVGARGKATLTGNIALDSDYRKVDLKGQAYFEIKALSFKLYEREFAKGSWTIYETGRNEEKLRLQSVSKNIYDSIDIHDLIRPEDRSYASRSAKWLGETPQLSLMDTDYSNKELRVLQTNAYPDAKPQIMDVDGTKVMVWVTDNTERDAANKSMLVYSVYDQASDTWSSPSAVQDDGLGDYYPVAQDSYVVWQKANREFDASMTLAEVAQSMEIYVSRFNGTEFDLPVRLTDNTIMDAQPHIAVIDDYITVVWTRNTDNNILGTTGSNSICRMMYNGSEWSPETELTSGLNTVAHIDVGYMNDEVVTAYVLDEDNDLNSIDDREIYLIRNNEIEQFTDNEVIDSHPVFENINGIPALFWYSGNNGYYVMDLDDQVLNSISAGETEQFTDDYVILSNGNHTAVLWTTVQEGISEVHGSLYDGSQWSHDIEITQMGQVARHPNGLIEENGELLIAFNRVQNVVDGDYYKDGQADLCVMGVTPSYDLAISNVFIGREFASDKAVPIYCTVTNRGELAVSKIDVKIIDVDGTENGHFTVEKTLQPGESAELEVYYSAGSVVTAGEIQIKIETVEGQEYNEDNNKAVLLIGQSDMGIAEINTFEDGDNHVVIIALENMGYTEAENVKIELRDSEGTVIVEQMFETVGIQEKAETIFQVDTSILPVTNGFIVLTASVTSDSDDANLGNNEQGFAIDKSGSAPIIDVYKIKSLSPKTNGVDVMVEMASSDNAQLLVAAYNDVGKMIAIAEKNLTDGDVSAGIVGIELDTDGAAYVQAFLVKDDGSKQPLAEKKTLSLL